jgi:hypothetical protein
MSRLLKKATCSECGGDKQWRECYACGGEGVYGHDCGEDTCCCLEPEDNDPCDTCRGRMGWYQCVICHPWDD